MRHLVSITLTSLDKENQRTIVDFIMGSILGLFIN